ncbi:plasma protease C1 inhibitor-like [Chiloscyllium punctatum]|uniref:plasma protease C1 inhibitor-like n=1 Tax=Chiloscyllium punctatum TaxID=137246 RepID=UPI003B63BDF3
MMTSLGVPRVLTAACFLSLVAVCSPVFELYVLPSRTDRQHIEGLWFPQVHCSQFTNPWLHCDTHKIPQHELQSLASSLTQFGLEAFHIIARYNREANLLISPVSLATALTYLLLGARNNSKHDLETALFYQPDVPCVHQTLKEVLRRAPSLLSVSQLFHKKDLQLRPTFLKDSQRLYGVKPMPLSTNMSENVRNINSWITKHTGGKITNLVNHVTADTDLMLLNAVYYKGQGHLQTRIGKVTEMERECGTPRCGGIRAPSDGNPIGGPLDGYSQRWGG